MRRIFLLGLAAVLLAACWGCGAGEPEAPTTETTTLETTEKIEITTTLDTSDPLVHTIIAGAKYRFPVINLDFPEAVRINTEALEICNEQLDALAQGWTIDARDDFYYAVHNDVLSLILCRASDFGNYEYRTWHLNIKTGQPVSNKELLKQAGKTEKDIVENLRQKIVCFYDGYNTAYNYNIRYDDYDECFIDYDFSRLAEHMDDDFCHLYKGINLQNFHIGAYRAKALAALNDIENLRFYWSGQERLFAVTELDFGGGADSYEVLFDPALPDDAYARDNHELKGYWEMLT